MIAKLIRWSIANRGMVLLAAVALAIAGVVALLRTPLDALPDLSDTEVIVHASVPGQAPQLVEDQVTYPLETTMMSVPGATATSWRIEKRTLWSSLAGARWSLRPGRSCTSPINVPPSATFSSWKPRQMAKRGTPRAIAAAISGKVVASRLRS